jgi:hypothetical protein
VQIEAATDASGRLTKYDVSINGTVIDDFDLVSRFGELESFTLSNASVSFSTGGKYFPRELSERSEPDGILGGVGAAYINIGQYEVVDETCEFGRRYISLQYTIEYEGPSIYDECQDDAQIWKVMTFLGCLWDVNDMNRESDAVYEKVDGSPPFGTPITLAFDENRATNSDFALSADWEFVDERPLGAGLLLRRYQSADASSAPRRDGYVLERDGFDGSVSIVGQDHTFFLLSCD